MTSLLGRKARTQSQDQFYYGYARQALEDAFRLLRFKSGDVVLYPDYICDVTLAPCHALGLKVLYYPVGYDFQPNWDSLEHLVKKGAKAVLSVNYFGFPCALDVLRSLADKHQIRWIEDNAHGYGSFHNGKKLGTFGDVGVSSLRKVLPLLNGASLHVNSPDLIQELKRCPLPMSRLYKLPGNEELWRFAGFVLRWTKIPLRRGPKPEIYEKMEPSNEKDYRPVMMDLVSDRLASSMQECLRDFARKRRLVYQAWENFCEGNGLEPVFQHLPPEASPMVFPCYAKNSAERKKWLLWGKKNRVEIHTWPSLPQSLRDPNGPSIRRWKRLLCFPVHQDIDPFVDIAPLHNP